MLTHETDPPAHERPCDDDSGIAVIWFALTLMVFLAMAGLGLDYWNWWRTSHEVQAAAGTRVHSAGCRISPVILTAREMAFDIVEANGFERENTIAQQGDAPYKLLVSVETEVDNYFVGLFGLDSTTIRREAVAEFVAPVPMGSPSNTLANDPEKHTDSDLPDHWMNVGSVRNQAGNGDRYQNGQCTGAVLGACTNTVPGISNPSYTESGYFFAVENTGAGSGPLRIEVFDPAYYEVGDNCTTNQGAVFNVNQASLQGTAAARPDIPDDWYNNASQRYVTGNSPRWCTGDHVAGASGGSAPITTTYVVRAPDNTPWIDTDNPVIDIATCKPRQFHGRDNAWMSAGGGVQGRLSSGAESVVNHSGAWQQTLANSFRRWVTVCEIPTPAVGRYLLQVRTNAPAGNPLLVDTSVNTYGHNRFALRAGRGSPTSSSYGNGVRLYANGRLPMYVNASGADTIFYLARVTPSTTSRTLRISLWDLSDGGSSGEMQVIPPDEYGETFSGCIFDSTGGSFSPDAGQCRFSFTQNALNSQLMEVLVPIPEDYTCTEGSPLGCWIRIRAPFEGSVNDTTTWSADIVGDPVRLVR